MFNFKSILEPSLMFQKLLFDKFFKLQTKDDDDLTFLNNSKYSNILNCDCKCSVAYQFHSVHFFEKMTAP